MNTEYSLYLKKNVQPELFSYLEKNGYVENDKQIAHTFELIALAVDILNRVGVSKDVDFVKKEVEGMINKINNSIDDFGNALSKDVDTVLNGTMNIDVEGSIMNKTKIWLSEKLVEIKTGAVDASKEIMTMTKNVATEKVAGIEKGIKDVESKFNPDLETSYLGMLKAVVIKTEKDVSELLNPTNTEGFAFQLNDKLQTYFGENSPILQSVQSLLSAQQIEFNEQLTKLREEIAQRVGIEDTMEKTAIKGFKFEDEVEDFLQKYAISFDDVSARVSLEKGRGLKGDFTYEFSGSNKRIVIECKDEEIGLKPTLKYLDDAMENRECEYSLVVTKNFKQLPGAVGGFNLYTGNKLFCGFNDLSIALRFYRLYFNTLGRKSETGMVDKVEIVNAVEAIKNELQNIRNVKTKLTGVDKFVLAENDKVRTIVDSMNSGILVMLNKIETEIAG